MLPSSKQKLGITGWDAAEFRNERPSLLKCICLVMAMLRLSNRLPWLPQ